MYIYIKKNIYNYYITQLTVESCTETGIGYHVLNTGYSPRSADCYLGWLDRRPDGALYHFYSLTDSPGTELDMEYHMFCTAKRGGLEGPRDDHVSHPLYLRLTSYYYYTYTRSIAQCCFSNYYNNVIIF